MNYKLKQDLLAVLGQHYILLVNELKRELCYSDNDVNDIMADYTVRLNNCNELTDTIRGMKDER